MPSDSSQQSHAHLAAALLAQAPPAGPTDVGGIREAAMIHAMLAVAEQVSILTAAIGQELPAVRQAVEGVSDSLIGPNGDKVGVVAHYATQALYEIANRPL